MTGPTQHPRRWPRRYGRVLGYGMAVTLGALVGAATLMSLGALALALRWAWGAVMG